MVILVEPLMMIVFFSKDRSQLLNIPVSNYTKVLVDNAIRIKGETSGVEAW